MATGREELENFRVELDQATTAVATRLESNIQKLANAATPEAVRQILQPDLDRLKALGSDPSDPIPTE